MSNPSEDQAQLWAVIVRYGFEEEYERDWLGRIRSRRTKRYLRAEITPELVQFLAGAKEHLGAVSQSAKGVIAAPADAIRRALFKQEIDRLE